MSNSVIHAAKSSDSSAQKETQAIRLPDTFTTISAVALSTTEATAWTPTSGKTAVVLRLDISLSAAAIVIIQDEDDNVLFRTPTLSADTPHHFDFGHGLVSPGGVDKVIELEVASGTPTANGTISGIEL